MALWKAASVKEIAKAAPPKTLKILKRPNVTEKEASKLSPFFRESATRFLRGDKNCVYSPLNLYMALVALSGVTAGNSQAQILDLLGAKTSAALGRQARRIRGAVCADDSASTILLESSLWLDKSVRFNKSALKKLLKPFCVSAYSGDMGSPDFNESLQEWLNERTRGLLSKQAGSVELSPYDLLAFATTVYFKSDWKRQFEKSAAVTRIFHAKKGKRKIPFMRQSYADDYYTDSRFSAVCKELKNGKMWLILPNFSSPADLLKNGEVMKFLSAPQKYVTSTNVMIDLSLPKFDVSADLNLTDGLKALGVTDVFDSAVSDFSPMTTEPQEIEIGEAKHAARVRIDENGCEGAAFTVERLCGALPPPPLPRIEFTLDQPFLFAVTVDNLPLFVGVVQEPLKA